MANWSISIPVVVLRVEHNKQATGILALIGRFKHVKTFLLGHCDHGERYKFHKDSQRLAEYKFGEVMTT